MRIDSTFIPQHVAKAYGLTAPQRAARTKPAEPVTPARPTDKVETQTVRSAETVAKVRPSASARASEKVQSLIGGVVPGTIDFTADEPQPGWSSRQMYTRPADRNAAATGLQAGRLIDTTA